MNVLKRYTLIGIIFVLTTGTISHFVYDWSGQNIFIGFFFPVNESTWEHMKLVFFPMLLYFPFILRQVKQTTPCITTAYLFATLFGTLLIPVLFYTYSGILGYNLLWLDLLTFVLSVLAAFLFLYKSTLSCRFSNLEKQLKTAVFLMAVGFFVFTYFPPTLALFENPVQEP